MDTILQIAAVGALLALTVLVVLSDAVGRTPRERPTKKPRRREQLLRVLPGSDEPSTSPAATVEVDLPRPAVQALPLPLGREAISAALRHRELGEPMLQPDPERFVQSEVLELAGPAARISALLRLVFWILLAGLGIGAMILGMVRGVSAFFENLLGV